MTDLFYIFQHSSWSITVPIAIVLSFVIRMLAIAFSNETNQEAEVELEIWDKLKFKFRTKKSD